MASRDIDTDLLRRTIDEIQGRQRPPSGEYPAGLPCKEHESRILRLEENTKDHEDRLNAGEKQFIRLENGLSNVAEKVGTLNTVIAWVGGAIGLGLLGTAGTALIWVIVHMGTKP